MADQIIEMTESGTLIRAFKLMAAARAMAAIYEKNRTICKYVHSVSSGHEAIQLATAFQFEPQDYVSPYYRDESLLLGLGFSPEILMRQLLAKGNDIFTGGKVYYSHPNFRGNDKPTIIHQSSATGMQAIPATGLAHGISIKEAAGKIQNNPVVLCSLGDASITEGEVSEAFQVAVLKKLPIIYLVQDNEWGISVSSEEARNMDAFYYAGGFAGMERIRIDGSDFEQSYHCMQQVFQWVRKYRRPYLVQARVPLLTHHTSGVRMEAYRSEADLAKHRAVDPLTVIKRQLQKHGITQEYISEIEKDAELFVAGEFQKAIAAPEPDPLTAGENIFVPSNLISEAGEREPSGCKENPDGGCSTLCSQGNIGRKS